jgi:membrane-associated phospholipid phosphatase
MKKLISENRFFFLPYVLFLLVCTFLLLTFTKPGLHIWLNQAHSSFFDGFFRYLTHLGDGTMIAILTIIFLFVKYRYAIAFLMGSLLTAGVVNLFKKVLLDDMYRPSKYFELFETYQLHLVEGVNQHSLQSFPSGHTATAFNVFLMLALVCKNQYLKGALLLLAVLVAYSRVYLSQHFIIDITVGSIISVILLLASFYWVEKWNKTWLNSSVLTKANPSK